MVARTHRCPRCQEEIDCTPAAATGYPLTERQAAIVAFLRRSVETRGYAPSFEEIAREFGYRSLGTVHEHLANLERKGYIRRYFNESRGIEVLV